MSPKKWRLLSKKDISPHRFFPLEMRTYRLPNGKIVEDFSVTTLADVAMIVAITKDKKIVLVNQYKPGVDEVVLEFPAGRKEPNHKDLLQTAQMELEEEVGIKVEKERLTYFATLAGFVTKASEKVYFYFIDGLEFNGKQKLDSNEQIAVVQMDFDQMEENINNGKIWCAQTVAGWELVKKKFPEVIDLKHR